MEALHDVVKAGKARYIGASSMYAWQFAKALPRRARRLDQVRLDAEPLQPGVPRGGAGDDPALPATRASASIPWSPLARGVLAGNRARGGQQRTIRAGSDPLADDMYTESDYDVVDVLEAVAKERGLPMAQIALAWLLAKPAVCAPIVGATKLAHINDAIDAVQVKLTDSELGRLEAPYRPHRILGHT